MLLCATIEEHVANATLSNALHAISLALYVLLQFRRRSNYRGRDAETMRERGCDARRAREGTRPLIHARCFYRRGRKGQSGPVYG